MADDSMDERLPAARDLSALLVAVINNSEVLRMMAHITQNGLIDACNDSARLFPH